MRRMDQKLEAKDIDIYLRALDSIFDGVVIYDDEGNNIYTNEAHLKQIGIAEQASKYLKTNLKDLNEINPPICSDAITAKVMESWQPYSGLVKYYRTGKSCLVSCVPMELTDGRKYIVSIVRDMTELLKLQTQLEEAAREEKNDLRNSPIINKSNLLENPIFNRTKSRSMIDLYEKASSISDTIAPVLILGETGVGKDFLAHFIHENSNRKDKPFIKVNCGAIPASLLESELFGYEPGAFTGANRSGKIGLVEMANKGTLYLDEIGEMPLDLQVKLLSVLQDKQITRLGGTKSIELDFRLISATNQNLEEQILQKKFRQDLFYRLNVVTFFIPPLRERPEDILPLVTLFLQSLNSYYNKETYFDAEAQKMLLKYPWYGNIRELKNIVERTVVLATAPCISVEELRESLRIAQPDAPNGESYVLQKNVLATQEYRQAMDQFEKSYLQQALSAHSTLQKTANAIGVDISTLVRKKKKYGI